MNFFFRIFTMTTLGLLLLISQTTAADISIHEFAAEYQETGRDGSSSRTNDFDNSSGLGSFFDNPEDHPSPSQDVINFLGLVDSFSPATVFHWIVEDYPGFGLIDDPNLSKGMHPLSGTARRNDREADELGETLSLSEFSQNPDNLIKGIPRLPAPAPPLRRGAPSSERFPSTHPSWCRCRYCGDVED